MRILTNEIDPVRGQYAWAYLQDQVATLNQQTIEHAIGESTGGAEEVRRTVARAKTITAALREARGDAARTRALLGDLRAALRPLDDSSRQAAVGAAGAELLLPGLGEPTGGRADLASAVARLRRSLDAVDGRAAPGDAPLNDGELAQIEADLAAIDRAAAVVTSIPAWVLSAPFHLELENVAPFVPDYLSFYAPAVVALLMQHLAITLGALSMTRVRLLGLTELLQTAPVRPSEAVAGNYLSYGTLCALAAAALVAALVLGLGVPVTGPWALVAGTVALLILTSLGGGFVVSMVAGSEQQAAQVAMLALIASVFLSGFVVSLDTIVWPVRALSYLLPSTYAIRGLQDVMLRGAMRHPADLVVLAMAALAACALTLVLVRREYRPR
ncbi:MAG: ABC transporter permease [Dehalococcoidia bacterium]